MPLLESVHESKDLIQEKDSLPIIDKRVPSKTVSNDLTLENCFESLSGLENAVAVTNCTTQVSWLWTKMLHHMVSNRCYSGG